MTINNANPTSGKNTYAMAAENSHYSGKMQISDALSAPLLFQLCHDTSSSPQISYLSAGFVDLVITYL